MFKLQWFRQRAKKKSSTNINITQNIGVEDDGDIEDLEGPPLTLGTNHPNLTRKNCYERGKKYRQWIVFQIGIISVNKSIVKTMTKVLVNL